jgi:hypothetical protein
VEVVVTAHDDRVVKTRPKKKTPDEGEKMTIFRAHNKSVMIDEAPINYQCRHQTHWK